MVLTEDQDDMQDPAAQARFPIVVSVYIPTFLFSEIGNGFVIYSLVYLKRRKRTTIDNYILNLAIGDFLITSLSLFNATEYVRNKWEMGEAMCKIHGQVLEMCYNISALTLLAISYERRNAVNDPFKTFHSKKALKRNVVVIWLAACLLTSPLWYAYTVAKRNERFHCSNTNFDQMFRSIYYLFQAAILFFVPVAAMILSQRKIEEGLRQHSQMCKETMDRKNADWKMVITREKKVGKFLTLIWVVFVCCFIPTVIIRTVWHFTNIRKNEIWNQIWHVSQFLALLNSAINPFLYYRTINRHYAKMSRIGKLLCCMREKKNVRLRIHATV